MYGVETKRLYGYFIYAIDCLISKRMHFPDFLSKHKRTMQQYFSFIKYKFLIWFMIDHLDCPVKRAVIGCCLGMIILALDILFVWFVIQKERRLKSRSM